MPSRLFQKLGLPLTEGMSEYVQSTDELQISAATRTAFMLSVSGGIICAAVVACLWSSIPTWFLVSWALLTFLALLPLPILSWMVEERSLSRSLTQKIKTWILRICIIRGLLWGGGIAVFTQFVGPEALALLCVLAIGNAMGTGAALMPLPSAAAAYGTCITAPLVAVLLVTGEPIQIFIATLLIVYTLGLRSAARYIFSFVQKEESLRKIIIDAKIEAESASRIKSDFLANMSHELRTPLNAIIGFSEVIADEVFGPVGSDRYSSYAKDINVSGQHLLRLINDVLDLSKIEAGAFTISEANFDLAPAMHTVQRLTAERAVKKKIVMNWETQPHVSTLRSDERLLQQILINLVTNAIKFTPEGGRIDIGVQLTNDRKIAIRVADTGIGMSAEQVAIALKPFGQIPQQMTARNEGTGLGLPLCQRFAEMLGGHLTIESRPGHGTTASVILPEKCFLTSSATPSMDLQFNQRVA